MSLRVRARVLPAWIGAVALLLAADSTTQSGAATDAKAIRKVDFRNFTYVGFDENEMITVVDGEYVRSDDSDPLYVSVFDVDHGDIDGDGIEEAVVSVLDNTGGTGQFTEGRVFKMKNGKPVQVTSTGIGDRADGGLDDIVIVNGILRVERYQSGGGGACCPQLLERSTYRLKGSKLVAQSKPYVRKLITLGYDPDGNVGPTEIKFLKGTSEAVLRVSAGTSGYFDAGKGQKVTFVMQAPSSPMSVRIGGPSGVNAILRSPTTWSVTLAASGRVTITSPATGAEYEPDVRMTLTIR